MPEKKEIKPACKIGKGDLCPKGNIKVGGLFYEVELTLNDKKITTTLCHYCLRYGGVKFDKLISSAVVQPKGVVNKRTHREPNPAKRTNEIAERAKNAKPAPKDA